jgi:energy-coupling factor transporter ATP-binding protein EcfA2
MAPLVDVAALTYRYPEMAGAALDRVDLRLDSGICLVAGPSGGGKSTLLRLFNGLVPRLHGGRVSGTARIDGHDVLRTPVRRLATSVGFLFQDAERQAVHATVERDIAFGLENLAVEPAQMHRRVAEVMERLRITHLASRTIASLSGGERQRVAVAGALVLRPRMLALDEPFSQLDVHGAKALLELCTELRDSGTLVVLSEHRLDEVLPVADAVVAVAGGRLSGPASAGSLAPSLDSAPQVVRLSRTMGWSPPLLDAAAMSARLAGHHPQSAVTTMPCRVATSPAWRLDGVGGGPGGVLRGVSAAGNAGEVIALMGRNGAGKTTLLRVIAGLVEARQGTVWREVGRVAYLPQNPGALLHRETVAAEVAWTLRAERRRGAAPDDGVLRALLGALGVDAIAARDPRDLSSGQRQRAAIAAILCGSPVIALLDEPTRGMDGPARDGLVAATRMIAARGTSVIVATHDSDLAAAVADRVLVVADGLVCDRGAPAAALSGQDNEHATQLGGLFGSPGPVTVEAVAALLGSPHATARVTR